MLNTKSRNVSRGSLRALKAYGEMKGGGCPLVLCIFSHVISNSYGDDWLRPRSGHLTSGTDNWHPLGTGCVGCADLRWP